MRTTRYFLCKDENFRYYKIKVNFANNEVTGIVVSCLNGGTGFMYANRGNIIDVEIVGLEIFTPKGIFKIECECFHNVEPIYL